MAENKTLIGNLAYKLTEQDKAEIAEAVKNALPSETWTFTLADGTTVTKAVCIK